MPAGVTYVTEKHLFLVKRAVTHLALGIIREGTSRGGGEKFFSRSRHCASVIQMQVPKLCTDLHLSLLYILILEAYSKFARKNNYLALGVCFPQSCSSAGRRFAESRSRLHRFVSTTKKAPRRGYRDSLLETVQEAITIVPKCAHI